MARNYRAFCHSLEMEELVCPLSHASDRLARGARRNKFVCILYRLLFASCIATSYPVSQQAILYRNKLSCIATSYPVSHHVILYRSRSSSVPPPPPLAPLTPPAAPLLCQLASACAPVSDALAAACDTRGAAAVYMILVCSPHLLSPALAGPRLPSRPSPRQPSPAPSAHTRPCPRGSPQRRRRRLGREAVRRGGGHCRCGAAVVMRGPARRHRGRQGRSRRSQGPPMGRRGRGGRCGGLRGGCRGWGWRWYGATTRSSPSSPWAARSRSSASPRYAPLPQQRPCLQ